MLSHLQIRLALGNWYFVMRRGRRRGSRITISIEVSSRRRLLMCGVSWLSGTVGCAVDWVTRLHCDGKELASKSVD